MENLNNPQKSLKPTISIEDLKSTQLSKNSKYLELLNIIDDYNFKNRKRLLDNKSIEPYENVLLLNLQNMISEINRINDKNRQENAIDKVYKWYNDKILTT